MASETALRRMVYTATGLVIGVAVHILAQSGRPFWFKLATDSG